MDVQLKNAVPPVSNVVCVAHRPNYTNARQRLQACKFVLLPNGEQARNMRRFSGSCRFVFNRALALQQARFAAGDKKLGYAALCKCRTAWRNSPETARLAASPVHPLQQTLKDLERADTNFFAKRADFPRFKKKGRSRDSFRYPDPKQIKLDQANSRLFLPKLGWLRYRNSRDVLGTVKNITVSQSGGQWFASTQTEREALVPVHQGGAVGIDMGIVRFATLSDGAVFAPLNSFKRHAQALVKAQRHLSHKTKFSSNWKKAKARVQRLHSRIGNARRDDLHKTTTISQNHAMVCSEDLQVRHLSASAAGTMAAPGTNVRAKSGLNQAILDQGWCECRRQLDYKTAWRGGHLVAVPPQNTSRTCPCCGHVTKENRQTQARFACVESGFEETADLVGAINVLRAGHARLACEVGPSGGQQQEPTAAAMREHARA